MKTATTIDSVRAAVSAARKAEHLIGCVMTMGALHSGHRSLMKAARQECDFVVATIFVNPTQFGPGEDFEKYPRTIEEDLAACNGEGVDLVFLPDEAVMYPPSADTTVSIGRTAAPLEGQYRPGHFDGVATVVLKLLNISQPDVAYFGQKDFQQVAVIRRMVTDLNHPARIVTCPTQRDQDDLAMSSRNRYLSADERSAAVCIPQSIAAAAGRLAAGETDIDAVRQSMRDAMAGQPLVRIQYASIADADTLEELTAPANEMVISVAAHVGETRLIDNAVVRQPQPEDTL